MTVRGRYTPGIIRRGDAEGTGTQGVLLFWDDTLKKWVPTTTGELFWDDTNKTVGINTATPNESTVLDANGTVRIKRLLAGGVRET